ncbi:MAG TPA: orotidine-5'-phosphate decarboxylase [Candidatus Pelethenecus faecipullorum]|uniref:Orotidine 5'-phosphate decarboxylase n=1 Tax=Candidatus Pelethenecus faecipullorum TaxID=2840900 RepID=A0A9D1GTJ0_9MOLU|nr:orotidine-5'-phosphate decarboxylase [Candidatus Pelethenecus faecipullorum]
MKKDVIIACDFKQKEDLFAFLKPFSALKLYPFLKIGMELFYKEGPQLIRLLKEEGYRIFLDLKLHDIPNTVEKAMRNLGDLGVDMVNVHAAGGIAMMKAAKKGLKEGKNGQHTKLIAVTVLTSLSEEILKEELSIEKEVSEVVEKYAQNAALAGLDGVVCSALEAPMVARMNLLSVTPGIRFKEDGNNDQKRVATPEDAKRFKADFIVVGRSITAHSHPVEAYLRCVKEFC